MTVAEIIQQLILPTRLGKKAIEDYGEPFILKIMNQIYRRLNEEWKLVRLTTTLSFDGVDTDTIDYLTLSAVTTNHIAAFRIVPFCAWRHPQVYRKTEPNTFSIWDGKIHFSRVTEDSEFEYEYFSFGSTLVSGTPGDGEVNAPEWKNESIDPLLLYETAIQLSPDYPLRDQDMKELAKLRYRASLERIGANRQAASPTIEGPGPRLNTRVRGDYYVDDEYS